MTSLRLAALIAMLIVLSVHLAAQDRADAELVLCRVLEVYSDDALKVSVVVFHQKDEAQRSQLTALLREHSGAMVELQAADGKWRPARLARLKSCFGRGLLILPTPAPFAEHADFTLRLAR